MPHPNFDKTVAQLDQPWFFGPQAGGNYQGILTTQFNGAFNRDRIEAALSLGAYLVHSEANKQKRAALRAVLLAKFLMNGHPVTLRNQLKRRFQGLDLASLKRAFASTFPALQDNGNRPTWDPANFTDPSTLQTLKKARHGDAPYPAVPEFRFIIHGVANYMGDVFDTPDILTRYEVLSMSLVSKAIIHTHPAAPQGVILQVPANNILAASTTDVAVQNYAPAFDPRNPNAVTITDNLLDVATRHGGLRTPDYLIQNIRGYPYYNEVVVCGRSGVPLPHGITGNMAVVGVYIGTDETGTILGAAGTRREREMRARACAMNYRLPLLYLPRRMATPGL